MAWIPKPRPKRDARLTAWQAPGPMSSGLIIALSKTGMMSGYE